MNNFPVVLLLTCINGILSSNDCPAEINAKIQECVQPVALYASNLGFSIDKASTPNKVELFPHMGTHIFMELCNRIRRFDQCVKEARWICEGHITLKLISSSYGYLCNEGYKAFMDNADCLMRLDQDKRVKNCHDHTLGTIKAINEDQSRPLPVRIDKMCSSLNYFATCVQPPVTSQCGPEAWGVIVKVLRDTTETLMPSCKFDASPVPSIYNLDSQMTNTLEQYVNDAAVATVKRPDNSHANSYYSNSANSNNFDSLLTSCYAIVFIFISTIFSCTFWANHAVLLLNLIVISVFDVLIL